MENCSRRLVRHPQTRLSPATDVGLAAGVGWSRPARRGPPAGAGDSSQTLSPLRTSPNSPIHVLIEPHCNPGRLFHVSSPEPPGVMGGESEAVRSTSGGCRRNHEASGPIKRPRPMAGQTRCDLRLRSATSDDRTKNRAMLWGGSLSRS